MFCKTLLPYCRRSGAETCVAVISGLHQTEIIIHHLEKPSQKCEIVVKIYQMITIYLYNILIKIKTKRDIYIVQS